MTPPFGMHLRFFNSIIKANIGGRMDYLVSLIGNTLADPMGRRLHMQNRELVIKVVTAETTCLNVKHPVTNKTGCFTLSNKKKESY